MSMIDDALDTVKAINDGNAASYRAGLEEGFRRAAALVADNTRLRSALREIAEMHKGDQPAAYGLSDLEWADRHIRHMRVAACDALKPKSD